jgi:hypothetical protein
LDYFKKRNGANVDGSTHKQVVDLIKSGGDELRLTGFFCQDFCIIVDLLELNLSYCNTE